MLRTADYKDVKALKSCHTEFVHIHSAAFFTQKGKPEYTGFPLFQITLEHTVNEQVTALL